MHVPGDDEEAVVGPHQTREGERERLVEVKVLHGRLALKNAVQRHNGKPYPQYTLGELPWRQKKTMNKNKIMTENK